MANTIDRICIVGAGGGGSWLCPAACLLHEPGRVIVVDGDTLEEKNLNRQLFRPEHIGQNKADCLASLYGCQAIADWYNLGLIELNAADLIFGCVDNNAARLSILQSCDRYGCSAIIAANERTSAEAYLYRPWWKESALDPRQMYPELNQDDGADPQARAIGCTGEAQRQTPQLVSANFIAVALAQHLFVAWFIELPQMDKPREIIPFLPHKLVSNLSRLESFPVGSKATLV